MAGPSLAPGCVTQFPLQNDDSLSLAAAGCSCIQMKSVEVPDHTPVSSVATLHCNYHLGKDKLYSVKWYKDSSEFYRFANCSSRITYSP